MIKSIPFCSLSLLFAVLSLPVVQTGATPAKIASAWYAGWHADSQPAFPLTQVTWSKYTHMTYAFAETAPDVGTLSLMGSNPDLLPQFVAQAHQHGVKALVSVGGWTGSRWWSSNVASAKNRTAFVKTLASFASKYKLDGLDFDWEYPGNQGIGCNTISSKDTDNFLAFIQELRKDPIGSKLILSAATATAPFVDAKGDPSSNVSGFGKVLDFIAVMNYDIWGPWSPTVGPNAPLDDSCAAPENQMGSATSAVQKWHAAGIPLSKLVLGVPSYGHSFRVRHANAFVNGKLPPFPTFDSSNPPIGDAWDDPAGIDECGIQQQSGGVVNFWGLISQGYLNNNGTFKNGIAYRFDSCSQTAYVYNKTTEIMVSFDDAKAFSAKGKFIKSRGIRGFSMWEAGGDFHDILLNSIRQSAGF
ncbi:glycoside hydrolase family 18 protein [Amanita thiersii Skay4041]|uniref:Glycoside hydrolase family 18 protein n=1 Tax=Amanita thiersii Skay4041 TaxID=703135 RepID=A0A2A9NSN7_9AGAR|nr:glycoside hydrolase family 18 protein [Amanita thiersii Skay4041]